MADDRTGLLSGASATPKQSRSNEASDNALYHDSRLTRKARLAQITFVTVVILMVVITVFLSIYRAAMVPPNGGLYVMLGLCLVGFVALEVIMIIFIRQGELPEGKTWFLYFVGGCVILEAIFTNVLLFQN